MSHESVIAALNALSKTRAYQVEMQQHVEHLFAESDRVAIILSSSMVEHVMTAVLEARMPGLNSDEQARIFGLEGPLGTFANKIRIGQGLGLFDRAMRKRFDIVRSMRNAAAHCVTPVTFEIPEFREGAIQLFSPKARELFKDITAYGVRIAFSHSLTTMAQAIGTEEYEYDEHDTLRVILELIEFQEQLQGSPETPEG